MAPVYIDNRSVFLLGGGGGFLDGPIVVAYNTMVIYSDTCIVGFSVCTMGGRLYTCRKNLLRYGMVLTIFSLSFNISSYTDIAKFKELCGRYAREFLRWVSDDCIHVYYHIIVNWWFKSPFRGFHIIFFCLCICILLLCFIDVSFIVFTIIVVVVHMYIFINKNVQLNSLWAWLLDENLN